MLKNTKKIDSKEFTDSIIVAFLDYLGYQVKPIKLPNERVTFEVSGANLDNAIAQFYKNPKVPILNFCSSYKKIRSMIFNMRGAA